MKLRNDLGRDSIPKLVLNLAVPTMIAQFVNVLYSIVDRMYIGNIPVIGDVALAGVGVCGPIVTLLSSFGTLVGLGGAPILAMHLGQKNHDAARKILANAFAMLLVLSVALSALFFLLRKPLLLWFGASGTTLPYADTYMTIYAAGTVFALLAAGLNSYIIAQGFSTLAMGTVLLGAVTNIALDPLFIYVFDMGVAGAAVATVIAQAASCAFVLRVLFSAATPVRITLGGYAWKTMRSILKFGFCPFIILMSDSVQLIVMNMSLKHYGGGQGDLLIACATIVQSFMLLVSMPLGGITGGTQPILSYNYGAQRIDRIRKSLRCIVAMAVAFDAVMFALSWVAAEPFVTIFSKDAFVLEKSVWGIRVFMAMIIPMAVQYALVDALTALGVPQYGVFLSLFRKTVFFVTTLVAPLWFGAMGVFYAEPVCDLLACCVSSVTFFFVCRRVLRRREAMPKDAALFAG